jgi:hypothetical protein
MFAYLDATVFALPFTLSLSLFKPSICWIFVEVFLSVADDNIRRLSSVAGAVGIVRVFIILRFLLAFFVNKQPNVLALIYTLYFFFIVFLFFSFCVRFEFLLN